MEIRKVLTEALIKLGIMKENTEQIIINCAQGYVGDWKEVTRHK